MGGGSAFFGQNGRGRPLFLPSTDYKVVAGGLGITFFPTLPPDFNVQWVGGRHFSGKMEGGDPFFCLGFRLQEADHDGATHDNIGAESSGDHGREARTYR
jgi:hypothetical protein